MMLKLKSIGSLLCMLCLSLPLIAHENTQREWPAGAQLIAGYYELFEYEFFADLVCKEEFEVAYMLVDRMLTRTKDKYWRDISGYDSSEAEKNIAMLHAYASVAAKMKNENALGAMHYEKFSAKFPKMKIDDIRRELETYCGEVSE